MINFRGLELNSDFGRNYSIKFNAAQKVVDSESIRLMESYVPIAKPKYKNRGKMSRSHKVITPGKITNTERLAKREYYINKGFSGPKRGKFWFARMKSDHKEDILRKTGGTFR